MKAFTCLTILVVAIVAVQAKPDPEKVKKFAEYAKACAADLGIELKGIFTPGQKPDFSKFKSDNVKCMPKCILEKFGYVDGQGKLMEGKLNSMDPPLKPATVDKVKECFAKFQNESDGCVKVKKSLRCAKKEVKQMGF